MKALRILLLVHTDLVPPESFPNKKAWAESQCKTEYDVATALKDLGHQIHIIPVFDDLSVIRNAVKAFKPHIAFNLLEEFNGQVLYEQNVVSYLELIGLKFTGSNPKGLLISRDKGLAKKLLTYHGIRTPEFRIFPLDKKGDYSDLKYPLFVKTLNEEASVGIAQSSIVRGEEALRERVAYLHENFCVDVLVERYIEGREFYVAIMGNRKTKTYPIWELYFKNTDFSGAKIATYKAKWDFEYRKKHGITTSIATPMSPELETAISQLCKTAYEALYISGYARMDLRLSKENEIYFIEANPNPDIGYQEDFAEAVAASGLSYQDVLTQILKLGLE
jgi:D-alanine-D-alanine ligase